MTVVNSVNNYRVVVEGTFSDWNWDVQRKDINDIWASEVSGTALTMRRAIKKARNKIPIQVIHSS